MLFQKPLRCYMDCPLGLVFVCPCLGLLMEWMDRQTEERDVLAPWQLAALAPHAPPQRCFVGIFLSSEQALKPQRSDLSGCAEGGVILWGRRKSRGAEKKTNTRWINIGKASFLMLFKIELLCCGKEMACYVCHHFQPQCGCVCAEEWPKYP